MNLSKLISQFKPANEQEQHDQRVILEYIKAFSHNILTRENHIAHITSSGFVMNEDLSKVLLVHHNIMNKWAWTGGHADGDPNLLAVAIKEAKEETGLTNVKPLTQNIMSLDILPVLSHTKNQKYVNTHLHLSVAYILIANEIEDISIRAGENSDVAWFSTGEFTEQNFNPYDVYLYGKLIKRAKGVGI